jgi:hypothetical protein
LERPTSGAPGTQCSCFTGTKVQILTLRKLQALETAPGLLSMETRETPPGLVPMMSGPHVLPLPSMHISHELEKPRVRDSDLSHKAFAGVAGVSGGEGGAGANRDSEELESGAAGDGHGQMGLLQLMNSLLSIADGSGNGGHLQHLQHLQGPLSGGRCALMCPHANIYVSA